MHDENQNQVQVDTGTHVQGSIISLLSLEAAVQGMDTCEEGTASSSSARLPRVS